jgi:hypothetical protein
MLRKLRVPVTVCAVLLTLGVAAQAQQTCTHNGQEYPDGTRIGDLKCEDGEWVVVE